MSNRPEPVTPRLLREWGLPDPGDSKKARGRVMVVGGSRRTPGAVVLAGESALRVGAGRLAAVVPDTIATPLAVVMLEAAVFSLPDASSDPFADDLRAEFRGADAVLVGPGFDDPDETRETLRAVAACGVGCLVLDAFAIGILPEVQRETLPERLILNANKEEAAILLGRDLEEDATEDLREIARAYDAVVHCYGVVVRPDGRAWRVAEGGPGLGTSGSGDVLAGAITGVAARGVDADRAAVWGSWAHAAAGERLTERVGLGFLARDLSHELTPALRGALTERVGDAS